MHTFSQKPKTTQSAKSTESSSLGRIHVAQGHDSNSILNPQHLGHDFTRIPVSLPKACALQTKLAINEPGDEYEQEADRVAEQVVRMPLSRTAVAPASGSAPTVQRECASGGSREDGKKKNTHQEAARVQMKAAGPGSAGAMEAPPIVLEVLGSPGQPLDKATRAFMEPRFGWNFSRVRVHTDEKAAESAKAVGAEAYTSGYHIALGQSGSLAGTQASHRLLAHELAHVVQQTSVWQRTNSTSHESQPAALAHSHPGMVALSPKKGRSEFVGMRLVSTASGEDVRVKKEVGSLEGYDDRLQAIAIARLYKLDPAAVVQGNDGKWHALEVSAHFHGAAAKAADTPTRAVYPLPALSSISSEQQKEDALRQRSSDIHRYPPDSDALRKAQKENEKRFDEDWERAKITRASAILGVPDSEIQVSEFSNQAAENKINIIEKPPYDGGDARVGPVGGKATGSKGTMYGIQIDLDTLNDPAEAQSALFHETSHLKDFELAQMWADKYRTEKDPGFDPGQPDAFEKFEDWINAKRRQRVISNADTEIVVEAVGRSKHPPGTEARANIRTFMETLRTGQADFAAKKLVAYAISLKTGLYGRPSEKSYVRKELINELSVAYQDMSETIRDHYDAAVAAAIKENPGAWIAELDFSKARKRGKR